MRRRASRPIEGRALLVAGLPVLLAGLPAVAAAQEQDEWCRRGDYDRPTHCEVRKMTLAASGSLGVDARPNGGIDVRRGPAGEVRVLARVQAHARSEERAREIADQVRIERGDGRIRSEGPRTERRESWSVSYRITVPADYDLDLSSTNGGLSVAGVSGSLDLRTTNGGIHLDGAGGDVRAHTTNGGLHVELAGEGWEGAGLDARTTNGGVHLEVPEGYSARLEAGTTNGGFSVDFPITLQGRIGRRIETELGQGGPPIRVVTTNGGVRVRRGGI